MGEIQSIFEVAVSYGTTVITALTSIKLTDYLFIAATALSPFIAVRVSKRLDRRKESIDRKHNVFRLLMTTRAYALSPGHVEALQNIDTAFSLKNKSDQQVIDSWFKYRNHLNMKQQYSEEWNDTRIELFLDMLKAMSDNLGYGLSKEHIKTTAYSPSAHSVSQREQDANRIKWGEVLDGKRYLPILIVNMLPDNTAGEGTEENKGTV